ncbi:MAG TPA: lipocalin-like domain-containing protein [Blastocatellia bacterium]|nr:lipocalin-like domain-containing protein [Blastocatellia bacterium]
MNNNGPKSEVRSPKLRLREHPRVAIFSLLVPASLLFAFTSASEVKTPNTTAATSDSSWREAEPGYKFAFPRDHAAHPEYGIEWWYYTGNLETKEGRRFGYQLTFFRIGVTPSPSNPSRWAVRDLYMAHFAISDIDEQKFRAFERINRAGIGWAGAATDVYRVWNEDWEARLDANEHVLKASEEGVELQLQLASMKPEVIHGENGLSQKGPSAGNASHYYSMTRMETAGRIMVDGLAFEVAGLSWMDHEFGTSFLEPEQVGWDWFSIQLDDGRELMLFEIRRRDGQIDPRSSGTLIEPDGRAIHIGFGEFTLTPRETWHSHASGATYPVAWTIDVPQLGLRLNVNRAMDNQELNTVESTGVAYWEGSVTIDGTSGERRVEGRGYTEMTGYAGQSMGEILH